MATPRRLAALLAASAIAIAACGSNDGGNGGSSASAGSNGYSTSSSPAASTSASASASTTESGSPAASTGTVSGELTVWGMGNEGTKLDVLAKDFMAQNPDLKINVTPVDWGQAVAKLQTAIGGKQTPDISQMGTDMMGQFVETGAIEAVPSDFDPSTYFEGAWNTGVVDGTAYGVPWYVETRLLFYRTDIAEKAGITSPPQTWDELKAMAKAMQEKGGAKWGISLGTKNYQELAPFIWSAGGDIYDGTNFTLDSPQAVDALTFYDSFFKEGLAPKSVPEGFDITPAFVKGTHPMFFSGPWHIGLIKDAGGADLDGKWAVAPIPKKDSSTSFVGGSNMVVFKDSQNKDAAWAFLKYLSDPATQVKWYEEATDLPAVKAAWDDPKLSADKDVQAFGQQLSETKAPPAIPTWSEVADAINATMEKVTTGGESPEQGAQDMQQQAEQIGSGG
jgi:multiple sugar transport system substrate-binding protein